MMVDNEPIQVAILIFDGVQIIDFTGPYEVFGQAGFHVFTTALDTEPKVTEMGMTVIPSFPLRDVSRADILVVPGGEVDEAVSEPMLLQWLASRASQAKIVLSVCNGAFFLAAAGLLENQSATTYYDYIDKLRKTAPNTRVVRDRRFVDNGTIITAAGLSSGIDGALHVVARIQGDIEAEQIARNMEYNWQPGCDYARAALADCHLHRAFSRHLAFDISNDENLNLIRSEGSRVNWVAEWHLSSRHGSSAILARLDACILQAGWIRLRVHQSGEAATSEWDFSGESGDPWRGVVGVNPAAEGLFHITVAIHRDNIKL